MTETSDPPQASTGELQTIVAARLLTDARSVFIGVGRPSTAALLARMVHNPDLVLVYESGTIGAKPYRVPLSIGDGELAETADAVVSVPEMFNYWIGTGRVQVAFLGAAQVDRHGNLNSTVIGDYAHPRTRLPGAGGAPEIASFCQEVVVIAPHTPRTFVERLDFRTTVGFGDEGGDRERWGFTGAGPTAVVTDLGVLTPAPAGSERAAELTLTQIHPGRRGRAGAGGDRLGAARSPRIPCAPRPPPTRSCARCASSSTAEEGRTG